MEVDPGGRQGRGRWESAVLAATVDGIFGDESGGEIVGIPDSSIRGRGFSCRGGRKWGVGRTVEVGKFLGFLPGFELWTFWVGGNCYKRRRAFLEEIV